MASLLSIDLPQSRGQRGATAMCDDANANERVMMRIEELCCYECLSESDSC